MFKNIKNYNKGTTYVELIVVLSIFAVMSSVVIFNYGKFQAKVDIKNLASDIALKVVEAQKSAVGGMLPPIGQLTLINSAFWKPAYGLYFNRTTDNKSFIYFTDIDQNGDFDLGDSNCSKSGECLNKISITKGNTISSLDVFYQGDSVAHTINDLVIAFRRPSASALIKSTQIIPPLASPISYVQITISSPNAITAKIKVYPSGRLEVN